MSERWYSVDRQVAEWAGGTWNRCTGLVTFPEALAFHAEWAERTGRPLRIWNHLLDREVWTSTT